MKRWSLFLYFVLFFVISLPLGVEQRLFQVREPASVPTSSSCLNLLSSFYSTERNELLKTRIENASADVHMFYRSFPPLYYKLAEKCDWRGKFGSLSTFLSVMAGDAHMENFGLKFYNKKLRLSVNDYDDLTYGPPFLDVLRLLTSARLAGLDIDKKIVKDVLESYKRGLRGKAADFSKVTKNLFSKSEKRDQLDPASVDLNLKIFLKKKSPNTPVHKKELESWTKLLSEYGEIKDSYCFIKQNGGSAGLKRYQFLMELDGKLSWIEAKEWSEPGYNVASEIAAPKDLLRYNTIMAYDRPHVPPRLAKFQTKTFYLRNIDDRETGVSLSDLKKSELKDVLIDEAYSLGDFHNTYMNNQLGYLKAMENDIRKRDIVDFVEDMTTDFSDNLKAIQENHN